MDTKLKNIKFSNWFKLLAVILGMIGVVLSFYGVLRYQDFSYGVQQDYKKSSILAEEISTISTNIARLTQLKSKEYILSGAGISDNELKSKITYKKMKKMTLFIVSMKNMIFPSKRIKKIIPLNHSG